MKKKSKALIAVLFCVALLFAAAIFIPQLYVVKSVENEIFTADDRKTEETADCILILGAGVKNGKPTPMLRDRLLTGIALYESGAAEKIIMSGDHGKTDYDEVNVMRAFALERGVAAEDIFLDHAGFSTYDSMWRAKNIFGAESVIAVSQKYHLYRAVYDAKALGIKAVGVSADINTYGGQFKRDIREIAARDKDFFKCIFKLEARIAGEKIPLDGDGAVTAG